jgi:hypothetical protein
MASTTIRNGKRLLVRVAATLALVAGLGTAAHASAPFAHAGSGFIRIPHCYTCFLPHISLTNLIFDAGTGATEVDDSSASLDVSGINFLPGDPVQVELVSLDPSNYGAEMATGDTTASLALTLPLGNGQYVQVPGGTFALQLFPDPGSPVACNWQQTTANVVATDESTGAQTSVGPIYVGGWWLLKAVLAHACPTPTNVLPPTATPTAGM